MPFDVRTYYDLRKGHITDHKDLMEAIERGRGRIFAFARQYFSDFPRVSSRLGFLRTKSDRFYILDCGCIYYRQRFSDGHFSSHVSMFRDETEGPCVLCNGFFKAWRNRVIDKETVMELNGSHIEMG